MRAEGDPHVAGAFIGFDSVGPEFGDPNERLGVEKQQDAGDSVGQGLAGACKEFRSQATRWSWVIAGRVLAV